MRLATTALIACLAAFPLPGRTEEPAAAPAPPARPGEAAGPAAARPAGEPAKAPSRDVPFEMESFQLVMLVRAPTWKKLPDAEAQALQASHLGHLTKMGEAGKAVVCGPFGNQRDASWRGACIYAVATPDEARALAGQDPAVKAGQLGVEVVTWWVGKGYMTFPKTPAPAGPPRP